MSQTSYAMDQESNVAGDLAYSNIDQCTILTYKNPVDQIKFGRAVAKVSADENGVEKPDSGSSVIVGVSLRDLTIEYDSSNENLYPALSDVSVMRRGQVYVYVEEDVTPDDAVFVRHTANGGLTDLGAFRTDSDSSNALALTTAKFLTSASAGGVAILDLNIA